MEEESFEVTASAALDVSTQLFFQLVAALDKSKAISIADLATRLRDAADDEEGESNRRSVVLTLRGIAQGINASLESRGGGG